MTAKEKENQKKASAAKNGKSVSAEKTGAAKNPASEMDEPLWSIVAFDGCAASGLTYDKAVRKLKKLAASKVAGLCIVTDEAAARIQNKGAC